MKKFFFIWNIANLFQIISDIQLLRQQCQILKIYFLISFNFQISCWSFISKCCPGQKVNLLLEINALQIWYNLIGGEAFLNQN